MTYSTIQPSIAWPDASQILAISNIALKIIQFNYFCLVKLPSKLGDSTLICDFIVERDSSISGSL